MIRIITALALRLFALYLLALGVLEIPVLILRLIAQRADHGAAWLVVMGLPAAVAVLTLGLFALLWRLGGGALRDAAALDSLAASAQPAAADLRRWQALLVGLLGLYFCCSALISAMTMVLIIWPTPAVAWVRGMREVWLMQFDAAALSTGGRLVVGLALLLGAWIAARRLRRGSVLVAD